MLLHRKSCRNNCFGERLRCVNYLLFFFLLSAVLFVIIFVFEIFALFPCCPCCGLRINFSILAKCTIFVYPFYSSKGS